MEKKEKNFVKKFPRGTWIFKQGESGRTMFIIHSGKVKLTRNIAGQLEEVGLLEKGDFFGEMSILEEIPRSNSAFAEEETDLIEIDREGFTSLLKSNVEIPIRMIRKYALRLEETDKKFEALLANKREYDKGIREIITQIKGSSEPQEPKPSADDVIAYLKAKDSTDIFKVNKEPTLIGRMDPVTNIVPDIDITHLDTGRTVSRRHARITYVNDNIYIIEEIGVTNGTFVNDVRLKPSELKPIKDGDKITLGKVDLILQKNF